MTNPEQLMQVRAAAAQLGVHENTLRRWEKTGLVRAIRLPSGVRRFRLEDIAELRAQIYGVDTGSHDAYHDAVVKAATASLAAPATKP